MYKYSLAILDSLHRDILFKLMIAITHNSLRSTSIPLRLFSDHMYYSPQNHDNTYYHVRLDPTTEYMKMVIIVSVVVIGSKEVNNT